MGKVGDRAVDKLVDAFRVVITGAVVIIFSYLIVEALLEVADLPSWITWVIIGILVFFVYIARDKVIEFTKSILK